MLQLILGRAGYGKTEYVFSNIKKRVEQGEDNIVLITPEQFSFVAERRLLFDLGVDKVNSVTNLSFSRLTNEIKKIYGGTNLPVLSKGAKAVLMKKAMESVQDDLYTFRENVSNTSFINSFVKIYDELKSCRVTYDDLESAAENTDSGALSDKLSDIALITEAYDALIEGEYYDPANELTRLYKELIEVDYFRDSIVYIDGFNGFVAQEYKIIETILAQAKEVYITFCSDSYSNSDRYDLFSYVNSNISILTGVAKKTNVAVVSPIILSENYRSHNDELKIVEKNIFSSVKSSLEDSCNNVRLFCAKNVQDECDFVSANIINLLKNGMKANDIAVICRDLDKYENELKFSFVKYGVPFFNDERQNISSEPVVMFLFFLLRIAMYSFRSEDILSLLKTGMTFLSDNKISELENYVYMWGINGSQWKDEFLGSPSGIVETMSDVDTARLESINNTRKLIVEKLNKFVSHSKNNSPSEICAAMYDALIDFGADKSLKNLAISLDRNGKSALAKEQGRIWDLMMDILDKLALVGGSAPVSYKEFYTMFVLMISNEDLGVLPSGLDNVQIGSADRIRCNNPKAVFVVGANDGEFPRSVTSAGLLSESDREELINNDFKLYSYGETLIAQEKYFAYMAVSAPSDKLFVSYVGGTSVPSEIVNNLLLTVPLIKTEENSDKPTIDDFLSDDNAFEIMTANYSEESELISSLKEYFSHKEEYAFRLNAVNKLLNNSDYRISDTDIAQKLFKKDMYLSASRIEDYYNCSFRYFCKYGIGARPRRKAALDPMQTGTAIHYVLEKIISDTGSKGLTELSNKEIGIKVDSILSSYLETKMGNSAVFSQRFKYQFMRISGMLTRVVIRLKEEFENSDFNAEAFELKIGDGSDNEPVRSQVLELPDGGTIRIKGSVDRVDTYTENGKQYVRVVDYKSGTKDFSLSDILYGLNLQMFVYLFNVCRSDSKYAGIAGGVLYMHSARKVYNLSRNSTSDDIESAENDEFQMQGVVLNDENNELAIHMEHDLNGKFIPVKCKGEIMTGNIVSLSDLGAMAKKVDELVAAMGANLHSGIINQNPVDGKNHDKTCEFCDYAVVCANRLSVEPRVIVPMTDSEALSAIRKENGNGKALDK